METANQLIYNNSSSLTSSQNRKNCYQSSRNPLAAVVTCHVIRGEVDYSHCVIHGIVRNNKTEDFRTIVFIFDPDLLG